MIKYALAYARRGLAVFPLKRDSKEPATRNGVRAATASLTDVELWWTRNPEDNIGIACGAPSGGLLVVDVDGPEGLAHDPSMLPKTPTVITAHGRHYYYRYTGPGGYNAVRIKPGIDLRWTGGYVVAPPSIHPTGVEYEWVPDKTPLAPPPEWLRAILQLRAERAQVRVHRPEGKPDWTPAQIDSWPRLPEGGRNRGIFRVGCAIVSKGGSDADVEEELARINAALCDPPLSGRELKRITQSVLRYR